MFVKKKSEDLLKLFAALSPEEKAEVLKRLGLSEDAAAKEETGETPKEDAAEPTDGSDSESEDASDNAEEKASTADEEPGADNATDANEAPADEENTDAPEDTAEQFNAMNAKIDAMREEFAKRLAELEAFVEKVNGEDDKAKGELGYQRAEEARAVAQKRYRDVRRDTIGI